MRETEVRDEVGDTVLLLKHFVPRPARDWETEGTVTFPTDALELESEATARANPD